MEMRRFHRRTLVQGGGAWAALTIMMAVAAPAFASSQDLVVAERLCGLFFGGGTQHGQRLQINLGITLGPTVTVILAGMVITWKFTFLR